PDGRRGHRNGRGVRNHQRTWLRLAARILYCAACRPVRPAGAGNAAHCRGRAVKLATILGLWLLFVAGGMFALEKYKSSPGAQAVAPSEWPADSMLGRVPGTATLVMMSHPRCPCTRASLAELDTLLSRYRDRLTSYIL